MNTSLPSTSGVAQQGVRIMATPGTWRSYYVVSAYAYQWQLDNGAGGAWQNAPQPSSGTSYLLTSSSVGYELRVIVTAYNIAGGS